MQLTSLYRAVWRWHFYAGLIVLPVLVWMATTGGLYLYKSEIERLVYGQWTERPSAAALLPIGAMVAVVERQTGARVTRIERPADAGESWRMTVARPDGDTRTLFVDPGAGQVMGDIAEGGVMETVKRLHSLTVAGPIGNTLVEIAAGWTILLCLTGFYLWWPRAGQRALALRGRPASRRFWRDFHASTGAIAGAVILFLAVTGMPWSGQWGGWLREGVNTAGLGRPPAPSSGSHAHHAEDAALPWAMRGAPMPVAHGGHRLGPDRIAAITAAQGIGAGMTMTLPTAPGAPWLVTAPAVRAEDARILWIDGASGAVLLDARFADFGAGARTIEWGIAVHQGQQYGEANRLLMLLGCIGVWLLALSAPILWWKRRGDGRLSAPPTAQDSAKARGVAAIMLLIGALFPLTGATMLAALAGEWGWRAFRSRFAT